MKVYRFLKLIVGHLIKGEFDHALYLCCRKLPNSLIIYNKSFVLTHHSLSVKARNDNEITVRIAKEADINDICRISSWTPERVRKFMESGGICFLSSFTGKQPSALTWLAFGSCYVRGMGFLYDFPAQSTYGVGTIAVPEDRGKGLYLSINAWISDYLVREKITPYYVLVQFDNERSLALRKKMGFKPFMDIKYLKLFCWRFCSTRQVANGWWKVRCFINEPQKDITIV